MKYLCNQLSCNRLDYVIQSSIDRHSKIITAGEIESKRIKTNIFTNWKIFCVAVNRKFHLLHFDWQKKQNEIRRTIQFIVELKLFSTSVQIAVSISGCDSLHSFGNIFAHVPLSSRARLLISRTEITVDYRRVHYFMNSLLMRSAL